MLEIETYKLEKLPNTAYYIPNFISESDEEEIIRKVYAAPKPKWKTLSNRRLQNWGGLPHPKGMLQEPLPDWLLHYARKIEYIGVFGDKTPNHVLVNEYLPGQGILPHEDGPLFYPTITTINVGSHTLLDYYKKIVDDCENNVENVNLYARYVGSVLLERRSLLVVQEELYHNHLHGIKERTVDLIDDKVVNLPFCSINNGELLRDTRISLTIRNVPHVVKANFLFKTR